MHSPKNRTTNTWASTKLLWIQILSAWYQNPEEETFPMPALLVSQIQDGFQFSSEKVEENLALLGLTRGAKEGERMGM